MTGPDAAATTRVRRARMASLLLDGSTRFEDPVAVVEWFGAMQGQDPAGVIWSLGLRTGRTRDAVESALESGSILRTWPMRGTLHLVPGRDARWMVEHLGARALAQAGRRRAALGIDTATAQRATDLLGAALADRTVLPRADCLALLESHGIGTDGQRGYHLLWYAAACGVICPGPMRERAPTFVGLDAWAPPGPAPDRPAALALIATRFVRSHGPVTSHDLARWADLTMADARAGLAGAEGVVSSDIQGVTMHMTTATADALDTPADDTAPDQVWALPGFDELVLGYRDRTVQLPAHHEPRIVPGGNGMFTPTLVVDGLVVGTWRRRALTRSMRITATPFTAIPDAARAGLEDRLAQYADFLGLPAQVSWADPTSA